MLQRKIKDQKRTKMTDSTASPNMHVAKESITPNATIIKAQTLYAAIKSAKDTDLKWIDVIVGGIGQQLLHINSCSTLNLVNQNFIRSFSNLLPFERPAAQTMFLQGLGGNKTVNSYVMLMLVIGQCTIFEEKFWIVDEPALPNLIMGTLSLAYRFPVWGFDERRCRFFFWAQSETLETIPCGEQNSECSENISDGEEQGLVSSSVESGLRYYTFNNGFTKISEVFDLEMTAVAKMVSERLSIVKDENIET